MQAEAAITSWRTWQCKLPCKPEIIAPIGTGLSNQSYLISAGGQQMVLRINADESASPGIDREREMIILRAASQAGIAPLLIHAEHAFFVSEFVAGENIINPSADEALVAHAVNLLRRCHALDLDIAKLDYTAHIQRYWDLIEENGVAVDESIRHKRPVMLAILRALQASESETVLCHHDPVKANFVGSASRLYLIDWEYAAKGLAVMDYAALAVEWGVADQSVLNGSGIEIEAFNQAKTLYQYMCELWALAQIGK